MIHGGRNGIASLHPIESALARPYPGHHRSLAQKAAAVVESMVGNHGVVDGDKRTAWRPVELLIERSGDRLAVPDDEPVHDLVVAVATGEIGCDCFVARFEARSERI